MLTVNRLKNIICCVVYIIFFCNELWVAIIISCVFKVGGCCMVGFMDDVRWERVEERLKRAMELFGGSVEEWFIHETGGGLVRAGSIVDKTVYVGLDCIVCGESTVRGHVVIEGRAVVRGGRVFDWARLSDNCYVLGGVVSGRGRVSGRAVVFGVVGERAHVTDNCIIWPSARVMGDEVVSGDSWAGGRE